MVGEVMFASSGITSRSMQGAEKRFECWPYSQPVAPHFSIIEHSSPGREINPRPKIQAIASSSFNVSLDRLIYVVPVSRSGMASTTLAEISRRDFQGPSTSPYASITDVKHLSSYNWIEAATPTIAVPGSPPLWSAPKAPRQLKKDSGLIYIAQNAARHPESPLEPLFRALYITIPSFDIQSIDVVTDRNNIRKLLSFINPGSTGRGLEPFTINIEVTKNTAIFSRAETATHEIIGPHEFRGFGHEFEKGYTTSQISGSTGHHRIISYRFGDLNFIVRHETDGYVDAGTETTSSNSKEPESDDLHSMLESLSLSPTNSPAKTTPTESKSHAKTAPTGSKSHAKTTPTGSKLAIKEEGQVVPLESTLEIKTRVGHKPLDMQEVAPQLWVSQTPKLVRAYHYKGTFTTPEVEDVAALIKGWEEANQADLSMLVALIKRLVNIVKGCGGSAVVKYDDKKDNLVVCKVDAKKMLPEDLYSKWDKRDSSEAESNTEHHEGNQRAAKPVDGMETKPEGRNVVFSPVGTKGKKAAEAAKAGGRTLPDDLLPNPKPTNDTNLSSRNKGGKHQAADSGKDLLSQSRTT